MGRCAARCIDALRLSNPLASAHSDARNAGAGACRLVVVFSTTLARALNPSLSARSRAEALVVLASETLDDATIAALLSMPREPVTAAAMDHALGFAADALLQRAEALDGASHGDARIAGEVDERSGAARALPEGEASVARAAARPITPRARRRRAALRSETRPSE